MRLIHHVKDCRFFSLAVSLEAPIRVKNWPHGSLRFPSPLFATVRDRMQCAHVNEDGAQTLASEWRQAAEPAPRPGGLRDPSCPVAPLGRCSGSPRPHMWAASQLLQGGNFLRSSGSVLAFISWRVLGSPGDQEGGGLSLSPDPAG